MLCAHAWVHVQYFPVWRQVEGNATDLHPFKLNLSESNYGTRVALHCPFQNTACAVTHQVLQVIYISEGMTTSKTVSIWCWQQSYWLTWHKSKLWKNVPCPQCLTDIQVFPVSTTSIKPDIKRPGYEAIANATGRHNRAQVETRTVWSSPTKWAVGHNMELVLSHTGLVPKAFWCNNPLDRTCLLRKKSFCRFSSLK